MLTYLLTLPGRQCLICIPTLHQSSASIPRQVALACQSRCRSSWSQRSEKSLVTHRFTPLPLFLLGYRGIVHPLSDDEGTERIWLDASFHLLGGSDTQSDSSGAVSASDSTLADSPSMPTTSATATVAAARRSGRQHQPAAEYWKMPTAAPEGAQ